MFVGIEGLLPAFHDGSSLPSAYVPADARWLIVDPDACRRALADALADADARYGIAHPAASSSRSRRIGTSRASSRCRRAASSYRRSSSSIDADATKLRLDVDDLRVLRQELDHARTFGDTEHVTPLLAALQEVAAA